MKGEAYNVTETETGMMHFEGGGSQGIQAARKTGEETDSPLEPAE